MRKEGIAMVTIEQQITKCERILDKYGLGEEISLFRSELIRMGYLLAMVDGELDKAELVTINNTFLTRYNQENIRETYYEDPQDADCFLNKVPEIVQLVAQKEKEEYFGAQCILIEAREVINAFKHFGSLIISCNGSRMKYEVSALDSFLARSINYIKEFENREYKMEAENKKAQEADFTIEQPDAEAQIQSLLKEVDSLIGLEGVKKEIHNLVNFIRIRKLRESRGLEIPVMSKHLVFTGNPGTGKTTIARKLAQIYKCLGILENGVLVETDRSGMVAGYMGQTAEKVREVVEKAKGGILFIDEAYTLAGGKSEGDYGQEAVDTLLKLMEDMREELIVIVAGYPEPMEAFLNSNPGLRSRFNKYITFEDYSVMELYRIFEQLCHQSDYRFDDSLQDRILYHIQRMIAGKGRDFANAREIRNYFEKVVTNQANRIVSQQTGNVNELVTIVAQDLEVAENI